MIKITKYTGLSGEISLRLEFESRGTKEADIIAEVIGDTSYEVFLNEEAVEERLRVARSVAEKLGVEIEVTE